MAIEETPRRRARRGIYMTISITWPIMNDTIYDLHLIPLSFYVNQGMISWVRYLM
jgi:hypothetical protein